MRELTFVAALGGVCLRELIPEAALGVLPGLAYQ